MTPLFLFTLFHTALSVVAIIAGLLVVKGMIQSQDRQLWTFLFLNMAALTTITGFFFPFKGATPPFILGIITIPFITLATIARYKYRFAGSWRGTYVVTSILTLYFNIFVLIVQAFQKVPSLNVLAPTQTEAPFKIAQLVALVACGAAGWFSFKKFQPKLGPTPDNLAPGFLSPKIDEPS